MANIKLKNASGTSQTYNSVSTVKLKDTNDNTVTFYEALGQVTTFEKDTGEIYNIQSNQLGMPTYPIQPPTKSGYWFRGWSAVNHSYISENIEKLPKIYNSNKTLYAMWLATPSGTATISGLGSENSSSVQFNTDSTFPTSFDEVTDVNNNVFIRIPTIYRKINEVVDNQITSMTLSLTKIDSSYQPYPCFLKEDGTTIMPYILIGKYQYTSTTEATSVEGDAVKTNMTTARQLAQAVGTGYQILDWQMLVLIRDLSMCIYNNLNKSSTNYFGLNFYTYDGNEIIDGMSVYNGYWIFSYKPSAYITSPTASTTDWLTTRYGLNRNGDYIKSVGYDSDCPFFNFASSTISTSGNYYRATSEAISNSGSFGINCNYKGLYSNEASWINVRARLCYRPISE